MEILDSMRRSLLQGALGEALTLTINERLKKVDYAQLVEPFKLRNETDGAWRCEFWGKIVRSAITAVWATGDCELRAMVDKTVQDILTCQSADGCISSYPPDKQLDAWDVWGRKYVLLALERYYEMLNPDPRILQCCCAMTDHLMTQIGSGENQKTILQCGRHTGMAASSILGAVVALWRLSGKEKYRDFAHAIIDSGCSATGNIFAGAAAGIVPAALGNGKAYEMTSCFQGVAELLLAEGKTDLPTQTMLMRYYQSVLEREIFVTGVGGAKDACGEYWYDGALRQTRSDCGGLGETCVAATWIRFCMRMLELTGDCRIADELEKSLYNTILGAMAPDGSHWMHVNHPAYRRQQDLCRRSDRQHFQDPFRRQRLLPGAGAGGTQRGSESSGDGKPGKSMRKLLRTAHFRKYSHFRQLSVGKPGGDPLYSTGGVYPCPAHSGVPQECKTQRRSTRFYRRKISGNQPLLERKR